MDIRKWLTNVLFEIGDYELTNGKLARFGSRLIGPFCITTSFARSHSSRFILKRR